MEENTDLSRQLVLPQLLHLSPPTPLLQPTALKPVAYLSTCSPALLARSAQPHCSAQIFATCPAKARAALRKPSTKLLAAGFEVPVLPESA